MKNPQKSDHQHLQHNEQNVSLESISNLAIIMAKKMRSAIKKIEDINEETNILALNAAIESSGAGEKGKGFGVVAEHMSDLSNETSLITKRMTRESIEKISELNNILANQVTNVRGTRLSNLALRNIDLIDRNMYERAADIRWWATENSFVKGLEEKNPKTNEQITKRLGTILKFYTVYHDLILCDLEGNVLANGNSSFHLTGKNIRSKPWFKNALKTSSGEEYGFEDVHKSPALNNEIVTTFSCKVHQQGKTNLEPIGVIAAVFKWSALVQELVTNTPLNEDDKTRTRICIVDDLGTILADSEGKILEEKIEFEGKDTLFEEKKNFVHRNFNGKKCCIAHARSPGFEGYSSGWHSLLIQELH